MVEPVEPALPRVLVTGASGFVGRHLVRHLRDQGGEVIAAVRSLPVAPERIAGVKYHSVGELGPDTEWRDALYDVDTVIHLAAHVHVMHAESDAAFVRVNEEGTFQLARQAAMTGVRRMIVVSSIKVNGEFTSNRPFTCTDPVRPADAYARSKLAAEERLWAVCGSSSLEGVVVRPPLIYGPGVKANFSRLVQTVQRGVPLPLGAVRNKRSLLNLWNLAAFLQLAIVHPAAGGKVWLVSDDEDLSTAELVARIGAALGRPARLLNVPVSLLELLARITGRVEEFRRLTQSLRIDCAAAKTELGYAPILGVQSAIERTVRAMCLKGASDVA